ncbi:hypothetical protein [Sulfurimonas sp. RIFCSPLOWO2_12_36_12]|uniref:hypothetical protein n=1 Tax=Sulfurimonas sp. RIFCSPLOWO2_12_36_12 TaxID=1802253 RepID=UPI0025E964B0|nr:hypothetical protein [Sulfurimonas sp. RIFCSPLOWO2_12_36_12]
MKTLVTTVRPEPLKGLVHGSTSSPRTGFEAHHLQPTIAQKIDTLEKEQKQRVR